MNVEPQWKPALSWAKFFQARLSRTEYADDLGLYQKMAIFQMKSEVFCAKSGW